MRYCFVPALLVIFLFSCTKEYSGSRHDITNDTIQQSNNDAIPQFSVSTARFTPSAKFLKREVTYLTNNAPLKYVRLFSYDNAQRCTEIKLGIIDSSVSNPVFNLRHTITFSYDGASIMPSSFSSIRSVFPNQVTVYYYKYNSLGRKIMDSVRVKNQSGNPADRVIHYKYENDQVYVTPVFNGFSMENNSLDTLSILTGGNIEKLSSRFIKSTGDRMVRYTFTYDQSVSPYNKLNIANSLYFESASLGIGYNLPLETHYMGVTTNNMTSWTDGINTLTFKYVYDQDSYPVKKEMFIPGETNPNEVILFEY